MSANNPHYQEHGALMAGPMFRSASNEWRTPAATYAYARWDAEWWDAQGDAYTAIARGVYNGRPEQAYCEIQAERCYRQADLEREKET